MNEKDDLVVAHLCSLLVGLPPARRSAVRQGETRQPGAWKGCVRYRNHSLFRNRIRITGRNGLANALLRNGDCPLFVAAEAIGVVFGRPALPGTGARRAGPAVAAGPVSAVFGRPVSLRSLGSASLRKPKLAHYGDRPSLDRASCCRPRRSHARTSAVGSRQSASGTGAQGGVPRSERVWLAERSGAERAQWAPARRAPVPGRAGRPKTAPSGADGSTVPGRTAGPSAALAQAPRTGRSRWRPRRFSDSTTPCIGSRTVKSQASRVRRRRPAPSEPMTITSGPFRSAWYRSISLPGGPNDPQAEFLQAAQRAR